jgi:hypothetical protein
VKPEQPQAKAPDANGYLEKPTPVDEERYEVRVLR